MGIDAVFGVKTSSRIDPLQIRSAAKVIKSQNGWEMASETDKTTDAVKPSEINHGNIPPEIDKNGGVTISHAEHVAVLSLPQLRRLRFPLNGNTDPKVNDAARTVLASLALLGLVLSMEKGCDLRSRCLLFPESVSVFEILEIPGHPKVVELGSERAVEIFKQSVDAAGKAGMTWDTNPIKLTPSPELVALIKKSQQLAAQAATKED